jgi:HEAT repeat protein
MSFRSSAVRLAMAASVVLSLPGPASATPPSKERVRMMLSGFEDVPSAAHFRALGPETLPVLIELYRDRSQPPFVRLRSVHAVGHFPTPATRTFLLAVARAPGQSDLFIREAVLALGRAFGERALSDVRPFLESPEPVVREGAALAIGRVGSPAALELLRRRLVTEGAEHVRETIQRQIRRAPR